MVFSIIAIALPLGVGLYLNRINATPIVQIPAYPAAPKPNGYDLYVAAATATTRLTPEPDPINDGRRPTDEKARAQRYSLARKMAWLGQNKKAFALFDQAMQTPSLMPPKRSFRTFNRGQAKLRQMARDKAVQSNARWMSGDYFGALQSGLDTIQMGHDLRRGGGIIDNLVGAAIGAMGRSATSDTIERIAANDAKVAARRLEKLLATRWDLAESLTEEKYRTQAGLLEVMQRGELRDPQLGLGNENPTLAQRFRVLTIPKQQIIDDVGADFDRLIANARLPYTQKGAPPVKFDDPLMKIFQFDGERVRANDARDLVRDRLLMLRLALRAYKLNRGVYPPDLNALVPAYLSAVPADPFGGGESLRYKSSGKTYVLWSIGPDGVDNGGAPIPPRGKLLPQPPGARKYEGRFDNLSGVGDVVVGVNG